MNWPLFWALTLAFGFVIGNIMLVKQAAKQKMPARKPLNHPADIGPLPRARQADRAAAQDKATTTDQNSNTPE